jgi:acyl-CoA synthetase (AMP-forming)/AMP-acid ligase II
MDKFDLKEICETIERRNVHTAYHPSHSVQSIMEYPELDKYDSEQLEVWELFNCADAMSLIRDSRKNFPQLHFFCTYGLTEAGSSVNHTAGRPECNGRT